MMLPNISEFIKNYVTKREISFFENGNKESFINSLKNSKNNKPLSEDEKRLITLDRRAEQLIKYIF